MKKVLFASVALLGLGMFQSATAADLRLKAPPPPPAAMAPTWSGLYFGVNVGYGVGDDPTTMSTVSGAGFPIIGAGTPLYGAPRQFSMGPDGVNGGVQLGYNWQPSPMWVFGVETDIQASGAKDSATCLITCGARIITATTPGFLTGFPVTFSDLSVNQKIDWFGTFRARLGYTVGPVLLYGTGGFAYGDVQRSGSTAGTTTTTGGAFRNSFAGSYNAQSMQAGWTIGGGMEGKLSSNWSVKAEYLYMDLGSVTDSENTLYTASINPGFGVVGAVAATRTVTSSIREHIVRVGLNYKFGG